MDTLTPIARSKKITSTLTPVVKAADLTKDITPLRVPEPKTPTLPSQFVENLTPAITQANDGLIRAQTQEAQRRDDVLGRLLDNNPQSSQSVYSDAFNNQIQETTGQTAPDFLKKLSDANTNLALLQGKFRTQRNDSTTRVGQSIVQDQANQNELSAREAVEVGNQALYVQALQGNYDSARQIALETAQFANQDRQAQLSNLLNQFNALDGIVSGQEKQLVEAEKAKVEAEKAELDRVQENVDQAIISGVATVEEMQQLTSTTVSDADKLALAQQIRARASKPVGESFTLSEGESRYDADGKLIAGPGINNTPNTGLLNVSQKEAADLNKELASSKQFEIIEGVLSPLDALLDFKSMFDETAIEVLPGSSKDTLQAKTENARLYLKELFNLGVLNGPDLELLEKSLSNVAGLKAALTPGRKKTVDNQLQTLLGQIESVVDRNAATILTQYQNYDPSQVTNINNVKASYINSKLKISPQNKAIVEGARADGLSDNDIIELLNPSINFPETQLLQANASGNLPQRNNNPGNVKSSPLSDQFAAKDADGRPITDAQGHLVFETPEDGFAAVAADINAKIEGNSRFVRANPTIAELGSVYAEDPNWPISVARIMGVDPNTPTALLPRDELLKAIMTQEGYFA